MAVELYTMCGASWLDSYRRHIAGTILYGLGPCVNGIEGKFRNGLREGHLSRIYLVF